MGHHLHGCTSQGHDFLGCGSVGFHFQHGLSKGGAFGKGHALRYRCWQHREWVVGQGGVHIAAYGGIGDFAIHHKSSCEIFVSSQKSVAEKPML
jgi:hypothetical protein